MLRFRLTSRLRAFARVFAVALVFAPELGAQTMSINYRTVFRVKYEKFGYVDRNQKLVIPAQFDTAADFSDGVALVRQAGKWRMIDTMGTVLGDVPDSLSPASDAHNGILRVKSAGGAFGFERSNGSVLVAPSFTKATDFGDGFALVEAATPTGPACEILNRTGKVTVVKIKLVACASAWSYYTGRTGFSDGRIAVRALPFEPEPPPAPAKGAKKPALAKGKAQPKAPEPEPAPAPAVVAPTAAATPGAPEPEVALIDTLGRLVTRTRFIGLAPFYDGLAWANGGRQVPGSYVDRNGKVMIDSVDEGGRFSEGHAMAAKWVPNRDTTRSLNKGVINAKGEWKGQIGFSFGVDRFVGGRMWAMWYPDYMLVDTTGARTEVRGVEIIGTPRDGLVVTNPKDIPHYVLRVYDQAARGYVSAEDILGTMGDFHDGRAAFAPMLQADSARKANAAKIAAAAPRMVATAPSAAPKPVAQPTKPGLWAYWVVRHGLKDFPDKGRQIWVDYQLFDAEVGPTADKLEQQSRLPQRSLAVEVGRGALYLFDQTGQNAASEILTASKLRLREEMSTRRTLDRISNNEVRRVKYEP